MSGQVNYDYNLMAKTMLIAAREASEEIIRLYTSSYDVNYKSDSSPVTDADLASDRIICSHLSEVYPDAYFLTEETYSTDEEAQNRRMNSDSVFIIDPIDGTDEFVSHKDDFCVSIAFSYKHEITCSVVAVPEYDMAYYAVKGMGAYKIKEFTKTSFDNFSIGFGEKCSVSARRENLIMVTSKSHPDDDITEITEKNKDKITSVLAVGSCLKGCMIAEGKADIYIKLQPHTKEWDSAGMQLICTEAGAVFTDKYGRPLLANRENVYNTDGFIILNNADSAPDMSEFIK